MINLFKYSSTIIIKSVNNDDFAATFINIFVKDLKWKNAKNVSVINNKISFTAGIFRWVTNWNQLNTITNGIVNINYHNGNADIHYQLFFKEWIILSILFIFLFSPIFFTKIHTDYILLIFVPIFWFALYYIPILTGIFLFNRILKFCIIDTKHFLNQ